MLESLVRLHLSAGPAAAAIGNRSARFDFPMLAVDQDFMFSAACA
jgi:hypothetical protein